MVLITSSAIARLRPDHCSGRGSGASARGRTSSARRCAASWEHSGFGRLFAVRGQTGCPDKEDASGPAPRDDASANVVHQVDHIRTGIVTRSWSTRILLIWTSGLPPYGK